MKKGIAASQGYGIGKVYLVSEEERVISDEKVTDIDKEKKKLYEAIEKSKIQLESLKDKVGLSIGESEAAVFDAHKMLLEDPEFTGAMVIEIEKNLSNVTKSIHDVSQTFIEIFELMEDEYMRERASDIKDISQRLIANATGKTIGFEIHEKNTIVVAHDLTPSDTAQLDKSKVIGFLTDVGGVTSHSAIMARTLGIPSIVGLEDITNIVKNGDTIIIDGNHGIVIINPDENTIKAYKEKKEEFLRHQNQLSQYANIPAITKEGKKLNIAGNIGNLEDVNQVIKNGGDGIGLFRTEFLYMERDKAPSEEEQYQSYKYVLEKMDGKQVVIRTLDIGGDKTLPYVTLPQEENPFLGYRAIRLCLDLKELFKVQLRALLRASVHGNLAVMFPMISGIEELRQAKGIVEECKRELQAEGMIYSDTIQWGIMIEIPAAAICADQLAQLVDFFSIGTNDLIQYTLAVDRMSEKVSYLYNPMHPGVLKLIKMTIDSAHKHGKWVGMCGEMAADEKAIPLLIEYGLDEFSMSASSILKAKKLILDLCN